MSAVDVGDFLDKFGLHGQFEKHGYMAGCYMQGHTIKKAEKLNDYLEVVEKKYPTRQWATDYAQVIILL